MLETAENKFGKYIPFTVFTYIYSTCTVSRVSNTCNRTGDKGEDGPLTVVLMSPNEMDNNSCKLRNSNCKCKITPETLRSQVSLVLLSHQKSDHFTRYFTLGVSTMGADVEGNVPPFPTCITHPPHTAPSASTPPHPHKISPKNSICPVVLRVPTPQDCR